MYIFVPLEGEEDRQIYMYGALLFRETYRYKPLATFFMFKICILLGLMSAVKILEDFNE